MKGALIASIVALSGCAQYDIVRDQARKAAAEGYDRLLAACQRIECDDISVAAFDRTFGRNPEMLDSWKKRCKAQSAGLPVKE